MGWTAAKAADVNIVEIIQLDSVRKKSRQAVGPFDLEAVDFQSVHITAIKRGNIMGEDGRRDIEAASQIEIPAVGQVERAVIDFYSDVLENEVLDDALLTPIYNNATRTVSRDIAKSNVLDVTDVAYLGIPRNG